MLAVAVWFIANMETQIRAVVVNRPRKKGATYSELSFIGNTAVQEGCVNCVQEKSP